MKESSALVIQCLSVFIYVAAPPQQKMKKVKLKIFEHIYRKKSQ